VIRNYSFLFLILLVCGCSSSKNTIVAQPLDTSPTVTGSILDSSAFAKGGTLLLDAFRAGPGAAADDETDQLSRLMIKGIKEVLSNDKHFTVILDRQQDSDYFLEGYIENYGRLKGHLNQFTVDGNIWLRSTGDKVFLLQSSVTIDLKKQDPRTVAYQMGQAIGSFIQSKEGQAS
jgi:hypothetical protein